MRRIRTRYTVTLFVVVTAHDAFQSLIVLGVSDADAPSSLIFSPPELGGVVEQCHEATINCPTKCFLYPELFLVRTCQIRFVQLPDGEKAIIPTSLV
jgi:hypothetical protein